MIWNFGCKKPGGRGLSPESLKEIPKSDVCRIRTKAGHTRYYRKGKGSVEKKENISAPKGGKKRRPPSGGLGSPGSRTDTSKKLSFKEMIETIKAKGMGAIVFKEDGPYLRKENLSLNDFEKSYKGM